MGIQHTIECDGCGAAGMPDPKGTVTGWEGWIRIDGVSLNGVDDPWFCPECRMIIMDSVDDFATSNRGKRSTIVYVAGRLRTYPDGESMRNA